MTRLLLIEDNFQLLRLYTKMLQTAGYEVISTTTVQAARDMLWRGERFDGCISDAQVGIVDAMSLLRDLNHIRGKYDVPILVITAHLEKYQHLCDLLRLPCLAKPFEREAFVTKVGEAITAHQDGTWMLSDTVDAQNGCN